MKFDTDQYKIYGPKHLLKIHLMINPGVAVLELLLGMRSPILTIVDKTMKTDLMQRSFIPCPHCKTIHDARLWSVEHKTVYKNWFGLYCIACGKIIPCIMNVFTFLILVLTFPFWFLFKQSLKNRWLAVQKQRFENIEVEQVENPFGKKSWVYQGLSWGLFMFFFMMIFYRLFVDEFQFSVSYVLSNIIIWSLGGLIYGYIMHLFMARKGKSDVN